MATFLGYGNGSSGVLTVSTPTTFNQTRVSCSGTAGSTSLSATGSFSAGQMIIIHQSRGTATAIGRYQINYVASYTTGTITLLYPLDFTCVDSGANQAQVQIMPQYSGASISTTLTASAWDGDVGGILAFSVNGTLTLSSGTISAVGCGYRGGNGVGATDTAWTGEGTTGASVKSDAPNGNGGGGGSEVGLYDAYGHGGSNQTQGEGSRAGAVVGQADCAVALFGGGGGGSASGNQSTRGSHGGGLILIHASNIVGTGTISAKSENGLYATGRPGGTGGGGVIILRAQTLGSGVTVTAVAGAEATGEGGSGNIKGGGNGWVRIEACRNDASSTPTPSTVLGGHSWCSSVIGII